MKFDDIANALPDISLKHFVMKHDKIYSLLYSPVRVEWRSLEEQIEQIDTAKLVWSEDKQSFWYIWGWPGPDANRYDMFTYGKGWAFTKEEIIMAWDEN